MKIFEKIDYILFSGEEPNIRRKRLFVYGFLLLFCYIAICVHLERNPLNVFRPLPVLDSREDVSIYIPDTDAKTVIEVKRKMQVTEDKATMISSIIRATTKGLYYENTRAAVPTEGMLRNVWFVDNGKTCVLDFRINLLGDDFIPIPGSEENFKKALKKSIVANIDGVEEVVFAENGVYNKELWETK